MQPDLTQIFPPSQAQGPNNRQQFEAIVVGAGPAGAAAARRLAEEGRRVLLLEKDSLPRYKPCGGGLSPKTVAQLPFPVEKLPHVRLDKIAFHLRGESPVIWDLPDDFPFYMVMRADLDLLLVQGATSAGAELRTRETVRELERVNGGYAVHTDRHNFWAPFVIGADGAAGVVRRSLALSTRSRQGVALECEVEVPDDIYGQYATMALFDVEAVPEGYGWVFPKRDHLSVGVGSMNPSGLPLKVLLQQFLLRYRLASPDGLNSVVMHTHPLPVATSGEPARSGNALLAGDAAGVADGFGGEGICYAMASGELAGNFVSSALRDGASILDGYETQLDTLLRRDHAQANLLGWVVRRFPDAAYQILTSLGEGKSVLIPLLLGEISFGEALRRLPRLMTLATSEQR